MSENIQPENIQQNINEDIKGDLKEFNRQDINIDNTLKEKGLEKDNLNQKIDLNKDFANLSIEDRGERKDEGVSRENKIYDINKDKDQYVEKLGNKDIDFIKDQNLDDQKLGLNKQEKLKNVDVEEKDNKYFQEGEKKQDIQGGEKKQGTQAGEQKQDLHGVEKKQDTQAGEQKQHLRESNQSEKNDEGLWEKAKHLVTDIKDSIVGGAELVGETIKEMIYIGVPEKDESTSQNKKDQDKSQQSQLQDQNLMQEKSQ